MFFRSKQVRVLEAFGKRLEGRFRLTPYLMSTEVHAYGWREGTLAAKLYDGSEYCGHICVTVYRNTLHIIAVRSLRKRLITGLIQELIDSLVLVGVDTIELRDYSNGYWAHVSTKYYPALNWIGVVRPA